MAEKLRTFIGIDPPEKSISEIESVIRELKLKNLLISWTDPTKLHLTLIFLGNLTQDQVEQLAKEAEKIGKANRRFRITPANFGAFPNLKLPKIIWLGLTGDLGALENLAKQLKKSAENLALPVQQERFVPHLTFGKVRRFTNKVERHKVGEELQRTKIDKFSEIEVDQYTIFKSTPTATGHIHQPLFVIKLSP